MDYKFDFRIPLIRMHKQEINNLVQAGYYSRVKNFIDRYEKDGEYLIDVELFSNLIILRYVSPNDGFKTVLQDKIEL